MSPLFENKSVFHSSTRQFEGKGELGLVVIYHSCHLICANSYSTELMQQRPNHSCIQARPFPFYDIWIEIYGKEPLVTRLWISLQQPRTHLLISQPMLRIITRLHITLQVQLVWLMKKSIKQTQLVHKASF